MKSLNHHPLHNVCFIIIDIDATLANRLNDRPQDITEAINDQQQQEYKPVMKCPKCGNDMIIRDRKNSDGKYLTCVGFPGCKNSAWLAGSIQNIEVLNENCEIVIIKIALILYF